jgi:hypothetical protein
MLSRAKKTLIFALAVLRLVIAERRDAPRQQAFSIVEMQVWQSLRPPREINSETAARIGFRAILGLVRGVRLGNLAKFAAIRRASSRVSLVCHQV